MNLSLTMAGGYDPAYPRNDVVREGCRARGIEVRDARIEPTSPFKRRRRLRRLLRERPVDTDFVFVPAFCHHEVAVAKRWGGKPVVFDPLVSKYLTKILDYRSAGRFSVHALTNHLADRRALAAADHVLADTAAHRDYYVDRYRVAAGKIRVLPLGYNAHDFSPASGEESAAVRAGAWGEVPPGTSLVGFYGNFNPLQGIDVILDAAQTLRSRRDIRFEIVGAGHTHDRLRERARVEGLDNVAFLGRKPYGELRDWIRRWDVCLGIFGRTPKAELVIPNKVFHYAACRRPILTKRTPAIGELFTDEENVALVEAEGAQLAERIVHLVEDGTTRDRLATAAHRVVAEGHTHEHVGARLEEMLREWKG
jgi:glycosyltransferase involved in cell wall biosynthesis